MLTILIHVLVRSMKWLADLRPSYFQGWLNQDVSLSNLDTLPEKIIYQRSCLKLHAPGLGRPKACQEGSCGPYKGRESPPSPVSTPTFLTVSSSCCLFSLAAWSSFICRSSSSCSASSFFRSSFRRWRASLCGGGLPNFNRWIVE